MLELVFFIVVFLFCLQVSFWAISSPDILGDFDISLFEPLSVWLVPIGLFGSKYTNLFADNPLQIVIGLLCCSAAMVIASRQVKKFEMSGKPTARIGLKRSNAMFLNALIGFIIIAVRLIFLFLEYGLQDKYGT